MSDLSDTDLDRLEGLQESWRTSVAREERLLLEPSLLMALPLLLSEVRRLRTENETLRKVCDANAGSAIAALDAYSIGSDDRTALRARVVALTEAGNALADAVDNMSLAWTVPMIPHLAKMAAAWRSLIEIDTPGAK